MNARYQTLHSHCCRCGNGDDGDDVNDVDDIAVVDDVVHDAGGGGAGVGGG